MSTTDLNPTEVKAELARILADESFQNSTVLSRFLTFIVNETLAGNSSELKEYIIALNVLQKKKDFNPQQDPIVRIHAGRLRRALDEYYKHQGKTGRLSISIPKGSYVPVFGVSETDGAEKTTEKSTVSVSRRRITVAVLPFNNVSTDLTAVSFADGLGDHISTELTRYTELSVISYYSCRNIIGKTTEIKELAMMLDATYLLTGTVQTGDDFVRVRVQLILGDTREQIWSHSYSRKNSSTDLFAIQDEIVKQVVAQIAGDYGAIFRSVSVIPKHTNIDDLKIYDAVFWYYHFVNEVSDSMFHKAEAAMQKAVDADPDYALGWAILGEILVGGYFIGSKSSLVDDQLHVAIQYAKKAIKIDPVCQHAYQTIALANIFLHQKTEALQAIHAWEKIKPAASGIMGAMGSCLIFCGEYEKGFEMLDNSVQLNPYYQWWFNPAISFYYFKKDAFEDALYWIEKMNMPDIPWELLLKVAILSSMNRLADAKEYCRQLDQHFPFLKSNLEAYMAAFLQDKLLVEKLYNAVLKAGMKD